jgi:uncharacterized protein (DUF736 family)
MFGRTKKTKKHSSKRPPLAKFQRGDFRMAAWKNRSADGEAYVSLSLQNIYSSNAVYVQLADLEELLQVVNDAVEWKKKPAQKVMSASS